MPTFSAGALAGREVPLPACRKETPAPARPPRTFTQRCSARPVRTCVPCGPTNPTSMPPHRDSVVRVLVSRYEFVPIATTGPVISSGASINCAKYPGTCHAPCQVPRTVPLSGPREPGDGCGADVRACRHARKPDAESFSSTLRIHCPARFLTRSLSRIAPRMSSIGGDHARMRTGWTCRWWRMTLPG